MNTTGFIRGYMAKNMSAEDFIKVVVTALSREFEEEVKLEKINDDKYLIAMDGYSITMNKELIDELKSPYGLDKYILENFENQGIIFDRNRSQYIKYCFGNYNGLE
ncbi:hypothetical protein KQI42_17860 [Tissierella sp. MSJ-40]|uniref:Uncharacterized protein n=1 Tax=Tissierella simiarum TaxID=2841534 RepID=A0ABS6EBI4_9FIRM|nr:hypothetical protein [Tissierella simiarum]MBU5439881.1 hypothetical protein [Tissierella simiarum]